MKKRVLSLVLALLLCVGLAVPAMAAEYKVTEVVPLGKYDWVSNFSEGLARVELNGKYGYIDTTGKEVIPCKYDWAEEFSEGFAAVEINDRYGYIDKTGKEVIPCKYDWAEEFSEGLAKVILNGKYSYIDKTGKEVISVNYDTADEFVDGLARIGGYTGERDEENFPISKWGYIDKTGKEVVPPKYDWTEHFSDGLAAVWLNDKCSYIDKTGKEVISVKCDTAEPFVDGLAIVGVDTGKIDAEFDAQIYKYGLIDKTGKEVVPIGKYDYMANFSEGLAAVEMSGKWGFIDKTGKEVIPCKYDDSAVCFFEGLVAVEMNDKWGYIDKTGKEVIPCKYDWALDFSDGLAVVEINDRYGFIDKTGKEVVPCKYAFVWDFSKGLAVVQTGDYNTGKRGVISIEEVNTAYARSQRVEVDGALVSFPSYALKDDAGNETNYVKVRDFALILNQMTEERFNVTWSADLGAVDIVRGEAYAPNGSELANPFSGDRAYETPEIITLVDGEVVELDTFQLKDDNGGGYTYYKLRDLGEALGIKVDWSKDRGIFIETR